MSPLPGSTIKCQNDQFETVDTNFGGTHKELTIKNTASAPLLPFTLEYLGGVWEGILIHTEPSVFKVWLQGFPPIASHQRFALFQAGKDTNGNILLFKGVVHDIHVHREPTCWEGSTEFLIKDFNTYSKETAKESGALTSLFSYYSAPLIGKMLDLREEAIFYNPSLPAGTSIKKIGDSSLNETPSGKNNVRSKAITITKQNGQIIHAFDDCLHDSGTSIRPVVVIAPGYGETKRDYLTLAYYLASNGFQVIRYDHTNHVGASEGDHFNFTLSSMKQDFQDVIGYVRTQWPACPVIGLASSMAARVAVKAEAEHASVDQLVLLVGIVNVRRTIAAVHLEDVFRNFLQGHYQSSANILGFNVGQQFLQDACQNHFVTLTDTLQDAGRLITPVMVVSAGNDIWVEEDDLKEFQSALGNRLQKVLVMPESLHRIQENPRSARQIYRQVVKYCQETCGQSGNLSMVQEPNQMTLGRQNRLEKLALASDQNSNMGTDFWKDYLQNFQTVGNCLDYLTLLDHVFHALGPVTPGQRILDVGCGNGTAGQYLHNSLSQAYRSMTDANPIHYLGIDAVTDALWRAKHIMELSSSAQLELQGLSCHGMKASWAQVDLRKPLPFADDSFDRILSNLVLGYLKNPDAAMKELYRVLAPGGRMVISNLKPDGDFSGIYQRLVTHAQDLQEKEQARELLNNYGKIRQAEKEGQFRFYTREQWRHILDALGQEEAQIHSAFANQAYLIVITKPQSKTPTILPLTSRPHDFATEELSPSHFQNAA
ncbi:MAG: alpha/beta hydrolase [Nitrospirales bacterium]